MQTTLIRDETPHKIDLRPIILKLLEELEDKAAAASFSISIDGIMPSSSTYLGLEMIMIPTFDAFYIGLMDNVIVGEEKGGGGAAGVSLQQYFGENISPRNFTGISHTIQVDFLEYGGGLIFGKVYSGFSVSLFGYGIGFRWANIESKFIYLYKFTRDNVNIYNRFRKKY